MAGSPPEPAATPVAGVQHGKGTLIDTKFIDSTDDARPVDSVSLDSVSPDGTVSPVGHAPVGHAPVDPVPAGRGRVDTVRIEAAVRELLAAIGEDPSRVGLIETPQRVAQSYTEYFSGIHVDPLDHLQDAVAIAGDNKKLGEMVLLRDIEFRSMCEHHLLPFVGVAHLAYLPGDRLVGLGRLARVVDTLAARPQLQERLTEEIADALETGLVPSGVFVMLDATHLCVSSRGTRQARSSTVTTAARGSLREASARTEVIAMIGAHRG